MGIFPDKNTFKGLRTLYCFIVSCQPSSCCGTTPLIYFIRIYVTLQTSSAGISAAAASVLVLSHPDLNNLK